MDSFKLHAIENEDIFRIYNKEKFNLMELLYTEKSFCEKIHIQN